MTMAGAPLLSCAILFPEVAELTICLVLLSIYSEALRQYLCMHNQTGNRTYWLQFYIPPRASGVFWSPLTKTSLALGARLQWPMFFNTTGNQYYKTCQKSTFAYYFPQTKQKGNQDKGRVFGKDFKISLQWLSLYSSTGIAVIESWLHHTNPSFIRRKKNTTM